jgi:DNA invertase Pin-like site-specific DNA recombinase
MRARAVGEIPERRRRGRLDLDGLNSCAGSHRWGYKDPHAQLLVQIQGVIAEYERAKITERYRRGKLFRLRQGEAINWRVPYGCRRVPRQGNLPPSIEIDESTAR